MMSNVTMKVQVQGTGLGLCVCKLYGEDRVMVRVKVWL